MAEANKFPRDVYKKIKQMDNVRLYEFLQGFYSDGRTDEREEILAAINLEDLREQISGIKGIGAARLDEIMSIVENYISSVFDEDATEEDSV